jgi:hypothetical protein
MKMTLVTTSILESGCYGVLHEDDGTPLCVTLERTFDDVKPVIPAGTYQCVRRMFNKGGYSTFEITGVVGHSALLFHKGNVETDSLGCVLLGSRFAGPAIAESKVAFDKFAEYTAGVESFELEVVGR